MRMPYVKREIWTFKCGSILHRVSGYLSGASKTFHYMRTLRTMSVIGSAAILLLAGTVVFAEERPENVAPKVNVSGVNRGKPVVALEEVKQNAQERMKAVRVEAQTRVTALKEKAAERVADIQDRADIAAGKGRDVTTATAAIQSAQAAIESARAAVTAQAAKAYVLDTSAVAVTTSTTTPSGQVELMKNLRTSFQNLHKTLFKDLFALRDGPMKDARKAVQSALQTLGKIPGVDEETATSAAATSAQ